MTKALLFWIIMLVWLLFGLFGMYQSGFGFGGVGTLLEFLLFAILGWAVFGAAVK